jgi:hypothetical protein
MLELKPHAALELTHWVNERSGHCFNVKPIGCDSHSTPKDISLLPHIPDPRRFYWVRCMIQRHIINN